MESTKERIKELLAEICAVDRFSIQDNGRLVAYGLDSVRATDFMIAIEDSLGVIIEPADAPTLQTVADVVAYVGRHGRKSD